MFMNGKQKRFRDNLDEIWIKNKWKIKVKVPKVSLIIIWSKLKRRFGDTKFLIGHSNYNISIASTFEPSRLPACSSSKWHNTNNVSYSYHHKSAMSHAPICSSSKNYSF